MKKGIFAMNKVTLPASMNTEKKLAIISEVYKEAKEMITHLDSLRMRNFNFALIIFAGLFGLGMKLGANLSPLYISCPLTALMFVFLLIDRKLHVYNHGYQGTSYNLLHKMAEIKEEKELTFEKYDYGYAKKAEWTSLQFVIFICLTIGGALSYFVLSLVQQIELVKQGLTTH